MKRGVTVRLFFLMAAAFVMAVSSGCEREPLYYPGKTVVNVVVTMDWRNFGGSPEGASIYFYPEGQNAVYSFVTNNVNRTVVQVPSGFYTVMVHNLSVNEFSTMHFTGMESSDEASANLNFKYFSWIGGISDTVGYTVNEPESIVSGQEGHFYVHDLTETVVDSLAPWGYRCDSVTVVPQQFVENGVISIGVVGIHNAKSVRAYLTGMARNEYLVSRTTGDSLCTHVMETWTIERDPTDYTKGNLLSAFECFGLPSRTRVKAESKDNKFHIEVLLVDNKTVITKDWYVGDMIKEYMDELILALELDGLVLPDVKPEGGTESRFDVEVEDWGKPDDVVVPM